MSSADANNLFSRPLESSEAQMGKASKALDTFIDNLKDSHLTNLKSKSGTITKDKDFRLDMQAVRQN